MRRLSRSFAHYQREELEFVASPEGYDETCSNSDAFYRRLWLTVVKRAVEEAGGVNCLTDRHTTVRGLRGEARRWISLDSWELRAVCGLASVDVERLLKLYGGKYAKRRGR